MMYINYDGYVTADYRPANARIMKALRALPCPEGESWVYDTGDRRGQMSTLKHYVREDLQRVTRFLCTRDFISWVNTGEWR